MKLLRNIIICISLVIILLTINWGTLENYILERILVRYHFVEFGNYYWVLGKGVFVEDVSIVSEGITVETDLALSFGLSGLSEVILIKPDIYFDKQKPIDLAFLYEMLWEEEALKHIPNINMHLYRGKVSFGVPEYFREYYGEQELTLDIDFTLQKNNQIVIYGQIGTYDFEFQAADQRLSKGSLTWSKINSDSIKNMDLFWQFNKGSLIIDYARGMWDDLSFWVQGSTNFQELSIDGVIRDLPLKDTFDIDTFTVEGDASIFWKANGIISNPLIEFQASILEGEIVNNPFTNLNITGFYDWEKVVVDSAWLQNNNKQHLSGWFNETEFLAETSLQLSMLKLPWETSIEGDVTFDGVFQGKWTEPIGEGQLQLEGTAYDVPLALTSDFILQQNSVSYDIFGLVAGGQIKTDGIFNLTSREGGGELAIANLNLNMLPVDFPLSGGADFDGELDLTNILMDGELKIQDFKIENYQFTQTTGDVQLGLNKFVIEQMELKGESSHYQLVGEALLHPLDLDLHINLLSGRVQEFVSFLGLPVRDTFDGLLEGYVYVTGPLADLEGRLFLDLLDGAVDEFDLTGTLDMAIKDDETQINRLRLETQAGILLGMGNIANKKVDIFLETVKMPLGLLTSYMQTEYQANGNVTMRFNAAGTLANLSGDSQIQMIKPGLLGYNLDALNAKVKLVEGEVFFSPVYVVKDGLEMITEGSLGPLVLPLDWKEIPVNLHVDIAENMLFQDNGFIHGDLTILGTSKAPSIYGFLEGYDLKVDFPFVAEISNGEISLQFNDSLVYMNGQGSIGTRGRFYLGGNVRLGEEEINGVLNFTDAVLNEGPLWGSVDGELFVTGKWLSPFISGRISLAQGRYLVNRTNELQDLLFNPELELSIVSENLQVIGPGIDISTAGKLLITGEASDPNMHGEINALGGHINYLGTNFMVEHGRMEFTNWRDYPWFELKGVSSIDDLEVSLIISGDLEELEFNLTSDPSLPEHEILTTLNWPKALKSGLSSEDFWRIVGEQTGHLMSGMERMIQDSLSLDMVKLAPDIYQRNLAVSLGKNLWNSVYLGYRRNLFALDNHEQIEVEYLLQPSIIFNTSLSNDGDYRLGIELKKRF